MLTSLYHYHVTANIADVSIKRLCFGLIKLVGGGSYSKKDCVHFYTHDLPSLVRSPLAGQCALEPACFNLQKQSLKCV